MATVLNARLNQVIAVGGDKLSRAKTVACCQTTSSGVMGDLK